MGGWVVVGGCVVVGGWVVVGGCVVVGAWVVGAAVVASYPFVTTVAGMSTLEGFLVEVVIELPFVTAYSHD